MLFTLFREFLHICLFRRGPQDLPASTPLLVLCLLASILGSVVIAATSLTLPMAVMSAVAETLFMCAAVYLLLWVRGHAARWQQTVTAIAGAGVVLILLALPLLAWILAAEAQSAAAGLPILLFYGIIIWNLMVLGHIFRHALSTLLPLGVFVALVYYSASVIFINWLIPIPAAN